MAPAIHPNMKTTSGIRFAVVLNGRRVSRHRTIEAAWRAVARMQRECRRNEGPGYYRDLAIVELGQSCPQVDVQAIGEATETSTGVDGGIDVSFVARLDGLTVEGEVTLVPGDYDPRRYVAWGSPDNWIDGRALAQLRTLTDDDFRAALSEIEAVTSAAAGGVSA